MRFLSFCMVFVALGMGNLHSQPLPVTEEPQPELLPLYDKAVAHLERVCDDYRRIRALFLARSTGMSVEEAYVNINTVMPVLEPLNRQILRDAITDPAQIPAHKAEAERLRGEVEIMIELAAKLLREIEVMRAEMAAESQAVKTLEELLSQPAYNPERESTAGEARLSSEQNAALEAAARENKAEPSKDLTPLMRRSAGVDMRDLTKEEKDRGETRDLFQSQSSPEGLSGRVTLNTVNHMMGRQIDAAGTPAEWMFIDTWYTIGPFPNPDRANLNRKFPPESVVDLDAVYEGKGGQAVRWEFVQAGEPMVLPLKDEEYAIYYAYTEIYLDRPMDLWVALGSDDKSNVWLNDQPIWISGDQLKGWRVNEGFRKVSFNAGRNRILYRIENGWRVTAFSFGIRVAE